MLKIRAFESKKESKMFHEMNGHFWGMGWWWIIGLVILIAVIWVIATAISRSNQLHSSGKTPIDILKERYARGEIDKDEFDERKKNL